MAAVIQLCNHPVTDDHSAMAQLIFQHKPRIAQDNVAHIRVILVFRVTLLSQCHGTQRHQFAGETMLDNFQRFAVYYAPQADSDFWHAGASWLGWNPETGQSVAHPDLGIDLARLTQTPRKYGLHGTLKPPMRLSCNPATFVDAVDVLAQSLAPDDLRSLKLKPIDGFLAVVPQVQPQALSDTAAWIVRALDPFRAPLSDHDLARRRAAGLTKRQDELLQLWGYPYVMDEFRFHITLTGRLDTTEMQQALQAAFAWFDPALEKRHRLDTLCLFGEAADGTFHLIRRFALRG